MKKIDILGSAVGLIAILTVAGVAGYLEGDFLRFNPINGHFQNFNAEYRLMLGQAPFEDFPVYLGFGPLLFPFPLFWALGGTLSASNTVYEFYGLALPGISIAVMMWLAGVRPWMAWPWAAFLTTVPFITAKGNDSAMSVRSFLPILAAMCFVILSKWMSNTKKTYLPWCITGLVAGIMPLWSNDYGIPTALAFLAVIFIAFYPGIVKGALICGITGLSAVLSLLGFLYLFTKGHPASWLSYTIGVSSDQFWYFNPNADGKTYSLTDIPHDLQALLITLPPIITIGWWCLRKNKDIKIAALSIIGISTLGGYLISGLAGTFALRYVLPVIRVDLVIIPWLIIQSLGIKTKRLNPFIHVLSAFAVPLAFLLFFGAEVGGVWQAADKDSHFIPELAGSVPDSYMDTIEEARHLKEKYDIQNLPADHRLFSTYATAVSLISGSRQPVSDYIIHALGDEMRKRYDDQLDAGFANIETMDPDVLIWGTWNIRSSWSFHKKLFMEWEPKERTGWSIIWSKRDKPLTEGKTVSCEITKGPAGFLIANIQPGQVQEDSWAEITVNGKAHIDTNWLNPLSGKGVIEAVENPDFSAPEIDYSRSFEMSGLIVNSWTNKLELPAKFPVRLSAAKGVALGLRSWPKDRASLDIQSCAAKIVVPYKDTVIPNKTIHRTKVEYIGAKKIWMPGRDKGEKGGMAWVLYTADEMTHLGMQDGDTLDFGDGNTGKILVRDFARLIVDARDGLELNSKQQNGGGIAKVLLPADELQKKN